MPKGFGQASVSSQQIRRYMGLSLGGAKSDRTCLTIIDLYTQQNKAFVIDVMTDLGADDDFTADQILLEMIRKHSLGVGLRVLGVDAPLTLPPCFPQCDRDCEGYEKCDRPEVQWMRREYKQAKKNNPKLKHFTPYSQRPVDLYFRYQNPSQDLFQDETLGANLAPQAVRMNYLKRFLEDVRLVEVWPKLVLDTIREPLKLTKEDVLSYRNLERGATARSHILDQLAKHSGVFIYERDFKRLVVNMAAFDSLICAWVAMQADLDKVVEFDPSLPLKSGWLDLPEI